MSHEFKLYQDGLIVAAGSCDDWDRLTPEILRYTAQYLEDGPAKFRLVVEPDKEDVEPKP